MAIIRNRAKIDATTEADIRRQDGQAEGDLAGFVPVIPPRALRKRLRMTQAEFARAIRIPLATLADEAQSVINVAAPRKDHIEISIIKQNGNEQNEPIFSGCVEFISENVASLPSSKRLHQLFKGRVGTTAY
jgi:hypothetical protein